MKHRERRKTGNGDKWRKRGDEDDAGGQEVEEGGLLFFLRIFFFFPNLVFWGHKDTRRF